MEWLEAFFSALTRWEWWAIAGVVFVALEVFLPGAIFLWPGLSALLVALTVALAGTGWEFNLLAFAVLSLVTAYFGRGAYQQSRKRAPHSQLNRRGESLIGRQCVLTEATSESGGRAQIGDSAWLARTPSGVGELAAGTHVEVVQVEGTVLIVKPS